MSNNIYKLLAQKIMLQHRSNLMFLVLFIAMLQCSICACNIESDTRIDVTGNSTTPVFTLKGSGNISRFVIYGPLAGEYVNEEDRPVLWKIFPDNNSVSKPVSDLPPIKFGELPSGWTQYTPKDAPPSPLVDGAIYRVVANVNSANSGYIDVTVRDGKMLLIR